MFEDSSKKLISIVTVCFNSSTTIRRTIESVLNQTCADDVEYILIDGNSTDNTVDIIKEYMFQFAQRGISYRWISEPDDGIYDAMNKGARLAIGKYLNFMNSGDSFFDNDVVFHVSTELVADLVYGNHAIYTSDISSFMRHNVSNYNASRVIPFCHQSLFIRKIVFDEVPFDISFKIAADYDQFSRCQMLSKSVRYIDVYVSMYLDGGISSRSRKLLIYEYYRIMKKNSKLYSRWVYFIRVFKFYLSGKNCD